MLRAFLKIKRVLSLQGTTSGGARWLPSVVPVIQLHILALGLICLGFPAFDTIILTRSVVKCAAEYLVGLPV